MTDFGHQTTQRITEIIKAGKAIPFKIDIPDIEYAEIRWSLYGLIDTNEIAVLATCGNKSFAASAVSKLTVPVMADRIWGMDVLDQMLADELGNKLWESHSNKLLQEVDRIRKH